MIAILVCGHDEKERDLISRDCRRQIARGSDQELRVETVSDDTELLKATREEQLIHMLYYSFRKGQDLEGLRSFRRQYGGAMVMLVADASVSPLEYLRPGIAPDSLLLRPLNSEKLSAVNGEFLDSFLDRFAEKKPGSVFVVETREEKVLIPHSQIYYFEAREKKLFVRTRHEEYAFYDTIEALEKRLPEEFRRCHRSYIVNTQRIQRILAAENLLDLGNQIGIPISRSYRAAFKGAQP